PAPASQAARAIADATGHADVQPRVLDLASLASVRAFAARASHDPPIQALVCNAGMRDRDPASVTADGFDATFQVNHLAHFLLTSLLVPSLAPTARVVVVPSGTHDPTHLDGRLTRPRYAPAALLARAESAPRRSIVRYSTSKLCNVLFACELHRRRAALGLPELWVAAYDPGHVPTTQLNRAHPAFRALLRATFALKPLGVRVYTVRSAARAMARLVLEDRATLGPSGRYFRHRDEVPSSPESRDEAKARELWEDSRELVGLETERRRPRSPVG
ncbi:MAG: SDR family NAD(P)-dependent oxidoreductase, partial [Myxococcota bacterium]|nr:SDR family NAD(P)-dependent oxidoreductase [Myxococcota bacterium]